MNNDICNGASYTCPFFGKKEGLTGWTINKSFSQEKNRSYLLNVGNHLIELNGRSREYSFTSNIVVTRTGFRWVVASGTYFECFTQTQTSESDISEDFTTVDTTLLYLDLRNDAVVYKQSEQKMEFSRNVDNVVSLRTNYDDAYMFPYIFEVVPITVTNTINHTILGELHREVLNNGYPGEVKVLMPLFSGGSPYGKFTQNDTEYDAAVVDWYYIPNHMEADGDQFLWWADWHKAVGVYNDIDEEEAILLWQYLIGSSSEPLSRSAGNGVQSEDFMGSSAYSKDGDIFFSASFNDGNLVLSRLLIAGAEAAIPQEKISVMGTDGKYVEQDSRHDAWYPIAPL